MEQGYCGRYTLYERDKRKFKSLLTHNYGGKVSSGGRTRIP